MTVSEQQMLAPAQSLEPQTETKDGARAMTADGLVKQYGKVRALDGVSFEVAAGEILCICGPNGAGKTTALEVVQGSRRPDAGTVSFFGAPPSSRRERDRTVRERVGVLFQDGGAPDKARLHELLGVFQSFYSNPMTVDDALRAVGLQGAAASDYKSLSGGQRRRAMLACALIGNPPMLLLDEPTSGLDPQSRELVWSTITTARAGGAAVLVTTHNLEEAEDFCDRVLLLARGRVLVQGPPRRVLDERGLGFAALVPERFAGDARELGTFERSTASRVGAGRFAAFFDDEDALDQFTEQARAEFGAGLEMQVRRARLEDLMLLAGEEES